MSTTVINRRLLNQKCKQYNSSSQMENKSKFLFDIKQFDLFTQGAEIKFADSFNKDNYDIQDPIIVLDQPRPNFETFPNSNMNTTNVQSKILSINALSNYISDLVMQQAIPERTNYASDLAIQSVTPDVNNISNYTSKLYVEQPVNSFNIIFKFF